MPLLQGIQIAADLAGDRGKTPPGLLPTVQARDDRKHKRGPVLFEPGPVICLMGGHWARLFDCYEFYLHKRQSAMAAASATMPQQGRRNLPELRQIWARNSGKCGASCVAGGGLPGVWLLQVESYPAVQAVP